jgi:hypothetical protein
MKIDLTTGTWQDNPGCPINITLVSTSDDDMVKSAPLTLPNSYGKCQVYCMGIVGNLFLCSNFNFLFASRS